MDSQFVRYVESVDAHLEGRLPLQERLEVRSEIVAHLQASEEAYRELGMPEEAAKSEALKAFGEPFLVAKSLVTEALKVKPSQAAARIALALAVIGPVMPLVYLMLNGWGLQVSIGGLTLLLIGAFLVACWKAARFMILPLAKAVGVGSVVLTFSLSAFVLDLGEPDGMHILQRSQVGKLRSDIAEQEEALAKLQAHRNAVAAGAIPRTGDGYRYPMQVDGLWYQGVRTVVYGATTDVKAAQTAWRQRGNYFSGQLLDSLSHMKGTLEEAKVAMRRPWAAQIPGFLYGSLSFSIGLLLMLWLGNGLVVAAQWMIRELTWTRRRRRIGGLPT